MTLNELYRALKYGENNALSHNERFILSKMTTVEPNEPVALRTADNQVLYTRDGNPIYTVK